MHKQSFELSPGRAAAFSVASGGEREKKRKKKKKQEKAASVAGRDQQN